MSEEQTYNVVYAGAIGAGFDQTTVKASFVSKLNIPEKNVDLLFSGKRMTLKKSLSKQQAEQWQQKLLKIGAETAVIPHISAQPSSASGNSTPKQSQLEGFSSSNKQQPVRKPLEKTPASQVEYDEAMEERIRQAKAMIASEQMQQQIDKAKQSNPFAKLVGFVSMLVVVIFILYFYADSMT